MNQSERYRRQNRISRRPKRSLLPGALCTLAALLLLMLLWTMPTDETPLQTSLAEDFSQTEISIEEALETSSDGKTTVINSSNGELNTPGVNGVEEEKSKKDKKKKKTSKSEADKTAAKNKTSTKSSKGSTGSSNSDPSSSSAVSEVTETNKGSSTGTGSAASSSTATAGSSDDSGNGPLKSSTDKGFSVSANRIEVYENGDSSTEDADSPAGNDADTAEGAATNSASSTSGVVDGEPSSNTEAVIVDDHDAFDYSGWGFSSYSAYVEAHPIKARLTYARLWTLRFLSSSQPAGCTSCSRIEESVPEKDVEVERPQSGQIFEESGQGAVPQLVVVAPDSQDAFVKLKREDGEVLLSFYVRSGTVVKACVPVGVCDFYYALGTDWKGEKELFGSEGVYAKSDRTLNFTTPLNSYEYRFGVENGNVTPKSISRAAF